MDHLVYILSAVAFGAACLMSFLGALVLFRYRENQKVAFPASILRRATSNAAQSKWKHRQREIEEHIDQQRKTLADMKATFAAKTDTFKASLEELLFFT